MKAPVLEEETTVPMGVEGNTVVETKAVELRSSIIPDLNEPVTESANGRDSLAVVPSRLMSTGIQIPDVLEDRREGFLLDSSKLIRLLGMAIESSQGGEGIDQEERRFGDDTLALTLLSGINGEDTMGRGDSPKSINSDPFNLAPFIFGMGGVQGESSRGELLVLLK